ncbi:MAG: RNA polymerase factor sigma-54 [Acidobacteria bacterium]|nr:RNA polymerase factor sigma-54 [Acidobacteriota bacterium]
MSFLSPRLQLKVAQKQILTPGLVQMVSLLQMNRLELKDLIASEVAQNPVLEEGAEGEDLTPQEVQSLLERERTSDPADQNILDVSESASLMQGAEATASEAFAEPFPVVEEADTAAPADAAPASDPFDEIDFGSFFDDYLDPGFKSPAAEASDKPSFETFLSSPVTLSDYLESQLSLVVLNDDLRRAADVIIGNLNETGYLTDPLEDLALNEGLTTEQLAEALTVVHSLDPAGVGARTVQECLLLQLASRNGKGGVAWQIVSNHLHLVETRQLKELAKVLGRPTQHVETALEVIRHLDPRPGLRYSGPGARQIEPDVYITKDSDGWIIQLNDDDLPVLRLNSQYRRLLDREQEPSKEVRNYVKERFTSALLLMKNIEQRKQTIMKVCESLVRRQNEFLDYGLDRLKPMMIKEIAEEIGVHPSTVSRAVANKYAHTPQGVFELRYFFSEAVQGPAGSETPLLLLKRMVKKMIEEEDSHHPLTDDQITALLRKGGIQVTRRTVAKYREDMKIPSTHQRRVRS